jgi:large subunit ribosomal protein L18
MKKRIKKLYLQQKKRALKKVIGSLEKPRLSVFRSHNHIYGQLIDDKNGKTLVSCSTVDKLISLNLVDINSKQEAASIIGIELAKRALSKNINVIVFDRGNRPYHGRIKSLAEGARQQGLLF